MKIVLAENLKATSYSPWGKGLHWACSSFILGCRNTGAVEDLLWFKTASRYRLNNSEIALKKYS